MAHPEHFAFVSSCKGRWPAFFKGTRVLDVGSKDYNGGVRELFDGATYVGVDCSPGKGVDVVAFGHEYDSPDPFDVAVCCETLEHDPHWRLTVGNLLRLLRPGGMFVGTWAGPNRPEHGTRRTAHPEEPDTYGPDPDYYANISADEFRGVAGGRLTGLEVTDGRGGQDVYAVGFRSE